MTTEASQQLFHTFCSLCEHVAKSPLKEKKTAIKKYIDSWKKSTLYKASDFKYSFYPALRLLCPSLEKERVFGFKEIRLGQEYVKILCLNKDSSEAKALTGYRQNSSDFAETVCNIMISRNPTNASKITIELMNSYLDKIAFGFSNNDKELVNNSLKHLVTTLSPLENKWLVRILTKNSRLGLSDVSILNTFHPQAKDHYENGEDLKQICKELDNPEKRSPKKALQPFKPFAPMLAERITANHPILNSTVILETKFDGERILLHKKGDNFQYFSRNGHNYSQYLNDTLTPFISASFSNIYECILDGELLVYNENFGAVITKNNTKSDVKRMNLDNLAIEHPIYIVFDLLVFNKNVLLEMPLSQRKDFLKDNITEIAKYLQVVKHKVVHTKNEVIEALNEAIENCEEGVMIKEINSTYKLNKRQKAGWYKLKPEYVFGLVDDLDLIIVGGYYGEGRRRGMISQFLLAALTIENETERFYSFCRVGSGYSDQELDEMIAKLDKHWITEDLKGSIESVYYHKSKPDVLIQPQNSLVLQIKGSEFTASDEFKTGFTLRFPRVVSIRYDKRWHDCTTVEELTTLREQGKGMLNTRRVTGDDSADESPSKRRKVGTFRTLAPHFQLADVSDINTVVPVFEGRELIVLNASQELEKSKLEELVKKYGGTLAANPNENTFALIAHSVQDLKAKNLMHSANYDILRINWFLRCIKNKQFIIPSPSDYWFQSERTKTRISRYFDCYGHSYLEKNSPNTIEKLFNSMQNYKQLNTDELAEIEIHVWNNNPDSLSLFRNIKLFVHKSNKSFEMKSTILKANLLFYGATLVDDWKEATHVLIDKEDINSVEMSNTIYKFSKCEVVDFCYFENLISHRFEIK